MEEVRKARSLRSPRLASVKRPAFSALTATGTGDSHKNGWTPFPDVFTLTQRGVA